MLDLAIVGGGPGGLMSAWYLRRKLGDLCKVTIFEASDRLGGKNVTRKFDTAPAMYEAGVAEIYDYSMTGPDPLRELIQHFGLQTIPMDALQVQLDGELLDDVPGLRRMLETYRGIGHAELRANYARFLREVVPTAEECGVNLCVHPDDPPRDLFGLPRVVSSADDLQFIVDAVPSKTNGITFCTGALGAGDHNNVPALAERFAPHIRFVHLRNVTKMLDGSFMEAEHLRGDVDMVNVVTT
ncbi:MAG: mannonate dehydratase, partial [Bradyrhizobium sp.]|nr:mannonate dehydratase [Bradyrhizobium sp.]